MCETEFCRLRKKAQLHKIFFNTYGREPKNDAEFERFLKEKGLSLTEHSGRVIEK